MTAKFSWLVGCLIEKSFWTFSVSFSLPQRRRMFCRSILSISKVVHHFLNVPICCYVQSPVEEKIGRLQLQEGSVLFCLKCVWTESLLVAEKSFHSFSVFEFHQNACLFLFCLHVSEGWHLTVYICLLPVFSWLQWFLYECGSVSDCFHGFSAPGCLLLLLQSRPDFIVQETDDTFFQTSR